MTVPPRGAEPNGQTAAASRAERDHLRAEPHELTPSTDRCQKRKPDQRLLPGGADSGCTGASTAHLPAASRPSSFAFCFSAQRPPDTLYINGRIFTRCLTQLLTRTILFCSLSQVYHHTIHCLP